MTELATDLAQPDDCPMLTILEAVANKWAVLALANLWRGPVRFNQLRRDIGEVSQKMLSQTLKTMERDGLVSREVFATTPVSVEYRLTPLGETLVATVAALRNWSEAHIQDVHASRRRYDSLRTGGDRGATEASTRTLAAV
jgi:DNA-binding HxlR family transcriptional regulator